MSNDTRALTDAVIDGLANRLAQLRVFLERHGSSLTAPERQQFECLRADFEVDFHLKLLEDAAAAQAGAGRGSGATGGQAAAGPTAKNRRLAAMNRLLQEGTYFSEKEMRERQPGMYHQYVGQYRPPEQPQGGEEGCQAGSILAQSIMRQQEELGMRERQEAEQRQWDQVAAQHPEEEGEEAGQGSEQQRGAQAQAAPGGQPGLAVAAAGAAGASGPAQGPAAAEQEDGEDGGTGAAAAAGPSSYKMIPPEEAAECSEALLDAMKQRFLAGQDAGVDNAAIDADAELDEDWADQQRRDAEDRYFDED